jgi:hypothetical protein
MYQFIIRNLDKIFISFSGLVLFELIQKHHNLKFYKKYHNYYIKNDNIYHIDIYKKDNLNNLNNLKKINKYNKYHDINFINLPYMKNINSISFVIKNNDEYEVFNNINYIEPRDFLYYNNDNIFETILKTLSEKNNTQNFIHLAKINKSDKNIKYKICKNEKALCLYLNDKLVLISDNFNVILMKSIEDEIKYITCSLIIVFFLYNVPFPLKV